MDGLIDSIFRPMLSFFIRGNIMSMLASVNMQAVDLSNRIVVAPSAWEPSIWASINRITDIVIVPIAGIILTCVMCVELIGWINERNNFHTTADVVAQLVRYIMKLGIGVLLVTKANELTMGIFDLSAWAIAQAMGVINTSSGELTVSMDALDAAMETAELGTMLSLALTSIFGKLGLWIMGLVVRLVITGRMIEIYVFCSMGSAPYATLTNKSISSIGQNYIKNLLALAFQGFFILIMIGIYVALMQSTVNSVLDSGNPEVLVGEVMLISGTLVFMLFRSKSIAKSIFSAH